jgi:outer membrane biosynthesis protein TonB
MELRPGIFVSAALHAALVVVTLVTFSAPSMLLNTSDVVPIEIVTVTDRTSVTAADPDAPELPDDGEPPEEENTAAAPPEEAAPPPEAALNQTPTRQPVVPAPQRPRPTPPRPTEQLDLDDLQEVINRDQDARPRRNPQASPGAPQRNDRRSSAGFADALTSSEEDALRAKMRRCWRTPADLPDPETLIVRVRIQLDEGGNLIGAPQLLTPRSMPPVGTPLRIASEAALRAIRQCQAYDMLSPSRYEVWKELTLRFDPTQMAAP